MREVKFVQPKQWIKIDLGDIGIVRLGKTPKKSEYTNISDYKIIKFRDITENKQIQWKSNKLGYVISDQNVIRLLKEVKLHDVLVTASAHSSDQIGKKVAIVSTIPSEYKQVFVVGEILQIRSEIPINHKWTFYYFQSRIGYKEIQEQVHGVHLIASRAKNIQIPLAPLPEQHRIVEKIETLFSELDSGVSSLKRAKAKLSLHRQSVLNSAFEGRLTEAWRKEHADELESTEVLLERIKVERETAYKKKLDAWKEAVKAWEGNGREGKKPAKPKKFTEVVPLSEEELANLPSLPSGWGWSQFEALTETIRNGISVKPDAEQGAKIFRISAVRSMQINYDDYRILDNSDNSYDSYVLQKGDLLFTRYNGSRQYVGVCGVFNRDEDYLFPDKLIQCRLGSHLMNPLFIEKAVSSGATRAFIETRIRTTAGQSGISGADIKAMPIAICSSQEQHQIVNEIESRLSEADAMEKAIDTSLKKAERLRQSILKKAFEGRLVPQDPDDEPASELLQRIREVRA